MNRRLVSYIAWRMGRAGFGFYHLTRDNKWTLCGRQPDGLLSIWQHRQPPPIQDQCGTCRKRESREAQ